MVEGDWKFNSHDLQRSPELQIVELSSACPLSAFTHRYSSHRFNFIVLINFPKFMRRLSLIRVGLASVAVIKSRWVCNQHLCHMIEFEPTAKHPLQMYACRLPGVMDLSVANISTTGLSKTGL
jgi:hypothetical protein